MPIDPTIDVSTGNHGAITAGQPFDFTLTSSGVQPQQITITAENSGLQDYAWFQQSGQPAGTVVIPANTLSVPVTALQSSPPGGWFTYSVEGMNVSDTNPHIQVGVSFPAEHREEHKKAS